MRFSKYFELNKTQYELDFVDIDLDNDMELFIDPWLIKGHNTDFNQVCTSYLQSYFAALLRSIHENRTEDAFGLLSHLREVNWTRLGYSSKGSRGRAVGEEHANQIYRALKSSKAVRTKALKDIEDTALLIPGIDRDKVSDMVTNVIMPLLVEYTIQQVKLHNRQPALQKLRRFFWNRTSNKWEVSDDFELPIYKGKPVLLVPKAVVSANPAVNSKDFYNKYILEYEQQRHLNNPSLGLCRVLKDGTYRAPTKKRLQKEVEYTNDEIVGYVNEHPELLKAYKQDLLRGAVTKPRKYKTKNQLVESRNPAGKGKSLDRRVGEIIEHLQHIKPGREQAGEYHKLVIGALEILFGEGLTNVQVEDPVSGNTKFIDVSFLNQADKGFFLHCTKLDIPCRKIYFECKNYTEDVGNNELDQLLGRFGVNTTRIGFIVCRDLKKRELFVKRCGHEVGKNRNYVLVLTDADLIKLLNYKSNDETQEIDTFLDARLEEINAYLSSK